MKDILLNEKISWPVTILLWAFCIALWVKGITPILAVIMVTMHITELFTVGFEIGAANGCGKAKSACMCMLFGLFWWVPLKRKQK